VSSPLKKFNLNYYTKTMKMIDNYSKKYFVGFNFMSLINISGSNYQEDTEKFSRYYHLIRNELFELEKEKLLDIFDVYYVGIITIEINI